MATTLALTLLLLSGGQAPTQTPAPTAMDTTTFTDAALGLSFSHPTTWTTIATTPTTAPPKPKGNRFKLPVGKRNEVKDDRISDGMVTFAIPGSTGEAPAKLTIVRASYSDAPEKWQQLQADTNQQLKREVERQWQQEILGVPLLLTRIAYTQDGAATTTVTGLLYNAAPYKLLFRLTGPTSGFDAAQYQFTSAMESLRTISNALPTAQEPGKPVAAPPLLTPDARHPIFVKPKAAPTVAPLALPVTVAGRKMLLHVPSDWSLMSVGTDTATLKHAGLSRPVTVKLYAAATAPRADEALAASSKETLEHFKTVELREDTPGVANKAGLPVATIWRRGTDAKGPYAALNAVVVAGDYYMLFAFEPAPGDAAIGERKIVRSLLDAVGLEPAP